MCVLSAEMERYDMGNFVEVIEDCVCAVCRDHGI